MPSISVPVESAKASDGSKAKLSFAEMFRAADGRSHLFTFVLVSSLFALWGFCNGQLDVLNRHFQHSLNLSIAQSTLVQSVTFIGYAIWAIPAGKLTQKYGYKGGIIIGLALVAAGAFWFIPATRIATYPAFLAGLFIIASGLACLETVANPYTTVLGPPEGAAARINLAQSCNGLGVMLGPIVGSMVLLSSTSEVNKSNDKLYLPYLGIALVVTALAVIFTFAKVPDIVEKADVGSRGASIWKRPHFSWAVFTQFCYVGAQIAVWALFINYIVAEAPAMSAETAAMLPESWTIVKGGMHHFSDQGAGSLLSFGFALFLLGRVTGSFALRVASPEKTLALYGALNTLMMLLVVLRLGWLSVAAFFASFFFMSLMFPTIFSLGIKGLGDQTKTASSFIVMAIGGGGVFPFINGYISDHYSMAVGFIVPLLCFAVVMAYGAAWPKLYAKS